MEIGDKVKINIESYDWQRNTLTEIFKNFIDNNKDTVFTIKGMSSLKYLCELKEDDRWRIPINYLILQ
jgi:hypothetical protein